MVGENRLVRLLSIELNGFKNVGHGVIEMPGSLSFDTEDMKAEIIGIYGQNGSGKTAVWDAIAFLRQIMRGESIPKDSKSYICNAGAEAKLVASFFLCVNDQKFIARYEIVLLTSDEEYALIRSEKLDYSIVGEEGRQSKKTLVSYNETTSFSEFLPNVSYKDIVASNKENAIKINVARVLSAKEHKSFVFSNELREVWAAKQDRNWDSVIYTLYNYAFHDLFVIGNIDRWLIPANAAIPFAFQLPDAAGDIPVLLNEPTVFPENAFKMFEGILSKINPVVQSIIPGLTIEIKNHGPQLLEDGKSGIRFELLSVRDGHEIPLRYESEGIKKILSILNILTAAYNDPSVLVVVDELDAGIFEYLLGELLQVFSDTGKGQLIFTSHNLRPLEMIVKNSIVFTTTNPMNRYIHLSNIKSSNNLRDVYLRSILVGGQKEDLYDETKTYEIRRALRKAGALNDA